MSALALTWYLIISLLILLYAVTDGFDLGVGIMTLLARDEGERGVLMESISGVWHANQTWLVILGGALFGAFPLVYGLVLSALYLPVLCLLVALAIRGVSLEYRSHAASPRAWSLAFGLGSLLVIASQALLLGALLSGLPVSDGRYAGGVWDFVKPLSLPLFGLLLFTDLLLGATYALGKVPDSLARKVRALAWAGLIGTLALGGWCASWAVSSGLADPAAKGAWYLSLAVVAASALAMLVLNLARGVRSDSFAWAAVWTACGVASLVVSLFPLVAPPALTLAEAVTPDESLGFMTLFFGLMLPVMFVYNGYQYWVFRSRPGSGGSRRGVDGNSG